MLATEAAYFHWDESQRALLAELRPTLEKHADEIVSAFYEHLMAFPAMRVHLDDPAVTKRLLGKQREYLLSLAGPVIDEAYKEDRARIGETHERMGIDTTWYLSAYSLYLSLLTPRIQAHWPDRPERALAATTALQRLLLFDAQIAMRAYIDKRELQLQEANERLDDRGRQLAQDLAETGYALEETSERANAAERLADVGVLVAGLAHEIGTPMGVIQGHAQLLEAAVRDDDGRWRLKTIREQVGRIQRIMQSLLNMARPGRHRRIPLDIEGLAANTLAFVQEKLTRRDIESCIESCDSPSVLGEPERLQQVLLNLFLNAADAMPDGGTLTVSASPRASDVELLIRDTGPGIADDDLERIFEPFFTSKAAGEGNGLGLSVARGICQEHGGDLVVKETSPSGTCFSVRLPLA